MPLNLQNAFQGSIIDWSPWVQAKQNGYKSNEQGLATMNQATLDNLAYINRANQSREALSEYEALKQKMQAYKDKEQEIANLEQALKDYEDKHSHKVISSNKWMEGPDGAWFDDNNGFITPEELAKMTPEQLKEKGFESRLVVDEPSIDRTVKHKDEATGITTDHKYQLLDADGAPMDWSYSGQKIHLSNMQKELADMDKAALQKKLDAYAWMDGPQFRAANEEYLRTGNSNLLTNLQAAYQNKILQEKQLAQQAAEKEEAAKDKTDYNELYAEAVDKVKNIIIDDKSDPNLVNNARVEVNKVIRQLQRSGHYKEAEDLDNMLNGKQEDLNNKLDEETRQKIVALQGQLQKEPKEPSYAGLMPFEKSEKQKEWKKQVEAVRKHNAGINEQIKKLQGGK